MSDFECKTESATPTWALIIPVIVFGILLVAAWVWGAREVKEEVNNKAKIKAKTNNNSSAGMTDEAIAVEVVLASKDASQAGAEDTASDQSPWEKLPFMEKAKLMGKNMWEHRDIYKSPALHLADTASDFAACVEFYTVATDPGYTKEGCS